MRNLLSMFAALVLLGAAFLTACSASPSSVCQTECGVIWDDWTGDERDCAAFKAQEFKTLYNDDFYTNGELDLRTSCGRVGGYHVLRAPNAQDGGSFIDPDTGQEVAGTTRCENRLIVVADFEWQHNAFSHELEHAVTYCKGSKTDLTNHFGPMTHILYTAINAATDDVPECL